MIKDDLVNEISKQKGISKAKVLTTIDSFMELVRTSMEKKQEVNLRGFGTFVVKKRAQKKARDISRKTPIIIPAHYTPTFKPAKGFMNQIKKKKVI